MSKFKVGDEVWVERERSSYYRGTVEEVLPIIHTSICRYAITDYSGCTDILEESKIEIMKKKANLTLETAKGFYKQGGAARDFALDNFSKGELVEPNWPESWDTLCPMQGYYIGKNSTPIFRAGYAISENKFVAPTKEDCESILAFCQLRQLAERMNDGWEPDWAVDSTKHFVLYEVGKLKVVATSHLARLIVFKTKEMAEFSLNNHRELWEQYYKL